MVYVDRRDGGRRLADRLVQLENDPDVLVVGLPRGGVPVAAEVAASLQAPLDVIVVRKLGVPFQPELGMGAIGEDDVRVINDEVVRMAHVTDVELAAVEKRERTELERRASRFRQDRPRLPLAGKVVVIVDDGVATGSTARAACDVARTEGAARVVLAVPVAPIDWARRLAGAADVFVAVETPADFHAVGQFYRDFTQTSDGEVVQLLDEAAERMAATDRSTPGGAADGPPVLDEDVDIRIGAAVVTGHLTVPEPANGLVIFAHGSGSSRHSPRNRYVASVLNEAGLATLLFDLLTSEEELNRSNVFDIDLLAHRLIGVAAWARGHPRLTELSTGYFGASTGAAAALWAAADPDCDAAAVVSRGGRPDLAGPRLGAVRAPTLLIVGGRDTVVLDLNRQARDQMVCQSELSVVPGATHLFEEPGTLRAAAEIARDWFLEHLSVPDHHG
jgi:putative phosphoribosyl transferase